MAQKSRTEYSALNTSASLFSRVATLLLGYVTRVIFTHMLSESYVGVNGLFMDIVNVLSYTELGIGAAITFALYKPVAEGDREKQKSLMRLYRNFYRVVACIVLGCGLLVVPFLGVLFKNSPDVQHLTLIYLMYLAKAVLSYVFIYKVALVDAHQKMYVGILFQNGFLLLQYVIQIAVLLVTRNFILYLSVYVLCTLLNNIAVSQTANRLYPYLRERNVTPLPKEERRSILRNIRAMLMHKLGTTIVNNTDNLLLSSMIGIVSVACYSNYFLLIGSVHLVLSQTFQGLTASVGNLGIIEDGKRIRKIFEASFFLTQWLYGFAAICLFELVSLFVSVSFGAQYVFDTSIVVVLCINFFLTGLRQATLVFRDSLGLFWYDRYKSVVEAAINLGASILLAKQFGAIGVFLGTMVSTLSTSAWVEPVVLYKARLKAPVRVYFGKYAVYCMVTAGTAFLTHLACSAVPGDGWLLLFLRLPICLIIPNVLFLACYFRTREFRLLLEKGIQLLQKKGWRKV